MEAEPEWTVEEMTRVVDGAMAANRDRISLRMCLVVEDRFCVTGNHPLKTSTRQSAWFN